jgi:DNA topoisomerase-1
VTTATAADPADAPADLSDRIAELYGDHERCASVAGLVYVTGEEPGIHRRRSGRGFRYTDARGRSVTDKALKTRIEELVIPPAWRNVWICPNDDGHIMAIGEDDRGRKQYIYHERWRDLRDQLNFYRLISFGEHLPEIRRHVASQLRRRTFDRDQVLAGMIRIIDTSGIRIGSEVYAEENDSFGLSTLTRKHITIRRDSVQLSFPSKSGHQAEVALHDRSVARLVDRLAQHRSRRLFTIDGRQLDAAEVNERLEQITGAHITAKDFRTWRGTLAAFSYLEGLRKVGSDPEPHLVAAADATAEALGNTRAVARAHYIHPHVLEAFADGTFKDQVRAGGAHRQPELSLDERRLFGFLKIALESDPKTAALDHG